MVAFAPKLRIGERQHEYQQHLPQQRAGLLADGASKPDERDKPFWLTLAQSWLRLAEHAAREGGELEKHGPPVSSGTH